jgi:hypothetical protein
MSNENMGFGENPEEIKKSAVEQDSTTQEIVAELEGLQGGLADVQESLEEVDQSIDTPERLQILRRIYETYQRIAVAVDSVLVVVGGVAISTSFNKLVEDPGDFTNVGKMIMGITTAAVGLSGFISRKTKEIEAGKVSLKNNI